MKDHSSLNSFQVAILVMSNFAFLKSHDPVFLQLAQAAERAFNPDPNTTLFNLRQLGEAFAKDIASRIGVAFDEKRKPTSYGADK
jgi:type I restriction enzyme R subunit